MLASRGGTTLPAAFLVSPALGEGGWLAALGIHAIDSCQILPFGVTVDPSRFFRSSCCARTEAGQDT